MKRQARRALLIVGLLLLATSASRAEAVLLGSFLGGGRMGHSGAQTPHGLITHQMFLLSYVGTPFLDQYALNPRCIGCGSLVPVGWTGTSQFDSSTSGAQFDAFLSVLTNANDESMLSGALYSDLSDVQGGGFGDSYESQILGPPAELKSWVVEFVILKVLSNEVEVNSTSAFSAFATTRWEFWGAIDPANGVVPEPATIALVGAALLGIAGARRHRHPSPTA